MALYLIGSEDISNPKAGLFYLDPHYIQKAVPSQDVLASENTLPLRPYLSQYHCVTLRTLSPSDMCTSMAPAFYLRDKLKFLSWKD